MSQVPCLGFLATALSCQAGSTEFLRWLEPSTRESAGQWRGELPTCPSGTCGDFESCLGVTCGAGSLLRYVDELGSLFELDGYVPSLVAVVHAFYRREQDPGRGEEQAGAEEWLGRRRGAVGPVAQIGGGVTKIGQRLVHVDSPGGIGVVARRQPP